MITVIMLIIFIVAYRSGSAAALMVVAIANCFVPDEVPMVDEIIEIALLLNRMKSAKDSGNFVLPATKKVYKNGDNERSEKLTVFDKEEKKNG